MTCSKLHRKIDQKKRTKIYRQFKGEEKNSEKNQILLTTDLAARGIDIPEVDWIVQFDPPQENDQFVHRIGRTARAGKSGSSLIFLGKTEEAYIEFLKRKKVQILEKKIESSEEDDKELNLKVK